MLGKLTEVKFIASISKMGDKLIIVIPKGFHKEIKPLKDKQIKVIVNEAIE
jgi:antitoxin component of MazEF toxin-antitoxin module